MFTIEIAKFQADTLKKFLQSKDIALAHTSCLHAVSKIYGFKNWNTFKAIIERAKKPLSQDDLLKNASSEHGMSIKIDSETSLNKNFVVSFQDLLDILKQLKHSAIVQLVCEKSNLKEDIRLYLLNDFLADDGQTEIEMFYQYYKAKDISLNNLLYKIDGNTICIDGGYDLTIETIVESDDDSYKELPHFKDRSLFGTFEITVDGNKEITLVDSSIGENQESSGFTEEELAEYYRRFPDELNKFPPPTSLNFEFTD